MGNPVTVNEAVVVNGELMGIGPEKRFASMDEVLEFLVRYPAVRKYFKAHDVNLRALVAVPRPVPK